MDERSREIGRRVGQWRVRRNLTRQQFADRVGRSLSWVDKVESGERALVRLPMLEAVAQALDIDPRVLIDDDAARRADQCPDAAEVLAIRSALGRYDMTLRRPDESIVDVPNLADLHARVEYACLAWLSSHLRTLGRVLPGLITEAQRAVEAHGGDDRDIAASDLVMVYRLASSTLLKLGCTDVAWMAADRAITAARTTDDMLSLARASRSVARAMTETGQGREAIDVLTGMAHRMEPELADDRRALLSFYGMLLLSAQIAAAQQGDADTMLELHREAEVTAHRLGSSHTDRVTAFGLTNVALHHLAALVGLHEGGRALEYLRAVDQAAIQAMPRERRVNYWLDVAEANRQCGNDGRSVAALLEAERVAPDEVRCRPVAHKLIRGLHETAPRGQQAKDLRGLAHRSGLAL
jgi:transcriptional regulator with XRE-family HTH domain